LKKKRNKSIKELRNKGKDWIIKGTILMIRSEKALILVNMLFLKILMSQTNQLKSKSNKVNQKSSKSNLKKEEIVAKMSKSRYFNNIKIKT
jgi:hypothetical protein